VPADILAKKVKVPAPPTAPRLVRLFDDPERDDRTWAISAAHALSMRAYDLEGANGDLVRVRKDGTVGERLLFDHDVIVGEAVAALRCRYEIRKTYRNVRPDPDGFLDGPVTLAQLRQIHEAVLGATIPRESFNRRMTPLLSPVRLRDGSPMLSSDRVGRPAQLYRARISK
jgi:8-oxo-dGTP diphosphatase